ncbi:MAG: PAS domain S-box protein, partial [Leptolyngbyaceae cyanobacterium RU_5_1]|nr:PAS domain S-box protein [Leptolyngbyaceae cyanobacterium RU_5_1]
MNQYRVQIAIAAILLVGAVVLVGGRFDITLLTSGQFIPHGHCYLWKRELVALHLLSDSLIALAYYSIPLSLIYFARQRQDIPYRWIFLLFSAFIIACGTTHVMEVWTLWHPTYWLSALIKAVTAIISLWTAVLLIPLVPKILALPGPAQLEAANRELTLEIAERKRTEFALQQSEERLQLALEGSGDGLWDWNIPTGEVYFSPRWLAMLGYTADELPQTLNTWEHLVHPEDMERVKAILDPHLDDSSVPYQFDYRLRTKSGEWKWIADYGRVVVRDEQGKPLRMAGTHRDISDRKQAELSLSRLAAIVESSGDAIIGKSLDGTITSWNAGAEKLLGYTAAEVIGHPITILFPPERVDELAQILARIKRGETIERYETVRMHKDGQRIDISATISPVKDATGQIIGSAKIARNITARKQAEAALQQSEARYRGIVEDQTELISRYSTDTTVLFVNEAYCRYFSVERAAMLGQSYVPLIFEADREHVTQLLNSLSLENPVVTIENRVIVNGQVRWTQWINRMIVDKHGHLIEYQSVGRDIHNLKQIEAALRQSEAKNRAMLAAIPDLLLRVKRDGTCLDFIPPTAPEAGTFIPIEQHLSEVLPTDLLQYQLRRMEQALATGKLQIWEHQLLKQGKLCDEELRLISCGADEVLVIVRDISDRKRTETELQHAKEAAEAANLAKSTFLATMSHELRTPLNAILGFAQLMNRDSSLNPQHQEQLDIILRNGEQLLKLINDVLDMSKLEAGQIRLDQTSIDLHQLLSNLIELLRLRANSKGLRLYLECAPNLVQFVQTDENKLRQILLNLLSNAIKFTERGKVTLRVRMGSGGEWGDGEMGRWGDGEWEMGDG